MFDDFNEIIQQIHVTNKEMHSKSDDQYERLVNFESRILDTKISENDQFFLNKEI